MRAPVTLSGLLDQELEDSFGEVVVLVKAIDKLFKVERVLRVLFIDSVEDPVEKRLDLCHHLILEIARHWSAHGGVQLALLLVVVSRRLGCNWDRMRVCVRLMLTRWCGGVA